MDKVYTVTVKGVGLLPAVFLYKPDVDGATEELTTFDTVGEAMNELIKFDNSAQYLKHITIEVLDG